MPAPASGVSFDGLFVPFRIDCNKSDFRLENNVAWLNGMPGNESLNSILNRGIAEAGPVDRKPYYLPDADPLPENDIIQCNGHKIVAREFLACGDVGKFVDPLEHMPAEKVAVLVEMSGEDYFIVFHN